MLSEGSRVSKKSARCKDARSLTAFTSVAAGNSETTQCGGLYTKDGVAPVAGATSFSSLGKVPEDGLAGGVGSSSLDYYVISGRTPKPKVLGLISQANGLTARDVAFKLGFRPRGASGDWQLRRVRRFFQRFYTGVGVGGALRVLTLTTSDEALVAGKDIHRSFRALVKRLRRRYGQFEYIAVREVKDDRVHLHVVFRGKYMQQASISNMWRLIHLSPIVDIRAVYKARGGARYLAKYLAEDACNRYWASYNWVFKGWVGWSKQFRTLTGHYPHQSVLQSLARLDVKRRYEVQQQPIKHERYFVPFHSWRYKIKERLLALARLAAVN